MACFTRMAVRSVIGIVVLVLGSAACVSRNVRPPPRLEAKVGGTSATYHDYRQGGVCDADPLVLISELESTNLLLAKFLGSTSAGLEGVWADEHLATLEQGEKEVPPMLDALEATWTGLPSCRFEQAATLADLTRKGQELARQSRVRVKDARYLREYVVFRRELASWNESVSTRREAAKTACKRKRRKKAAPPEAFFAAEDEKGVQTFEFCDGATVKRAIGTSPEVTPPEKKKGRAPKAAAPEVYLGAISAFAAEQIERAPKPPRRLLPKEAEADEKAPTGFADEF